MKELKDLFYTENVTGNNTEVCTYTTILVLFHLLSPLIDWQPQSIEVVREHIFVICLHIIPMSMIVRENTKNRKQVTGFLEIETKFSRNSALNS